MTNVPPEIWILRSMARTSWSPDGTWRERPLGRDEYGRVPVRYVPGDDQDELRRRADALYEALSAVLPWAHLPPAVSGDDARRALRGYEEITGE